MWTVLIISFSNEVSSQKFEDQQSMNVFVSSLNWDDISMITVNNSEDEGELNDKDHPNDNDCRNGTGTYPGA